MHNVRFRTKIRILVYTVLAVVGAVTASNLHRMAQTDRVVGEVSEGADEIGAVADGFKPFSREAVLEKLAHMGLAR